MNSEVSPASPPRPSDVERYGFHLDTAKADISYRGTPLQLDRSGYALLSLLLERHGQTVGKNELLAAGWPGRVVTENSLTKAIGRLRTALGDSDARLIRVIHGYGYRLVPIDGEATVDPAVDRREDNPVPAVTVHPSTTVASSTPGGATIPTPTDGGGTAPVWQPQLWRRGAFRVAMAALVVLLAVIGGIRLSWYTNVSQATTETVSPSLPGSVVVLPFSDVSMARGASVDPIFSIGLSEQLAADLARLPQLKVAAWEHGKVVYAADGDVSHIGREMKVATVLRGLIERHEDRFSIRLELIDSASGGQRWSQTYQTSLPELLATEDAMVHGLVGAFGLELSPQQAAELVRHGTRNPEAYAEYLLATKTYRDDETASRRSIAALERAVSLDPNYVDAWLELAGQLGFSGFYADDPEEALNGKRRALAILDRIALLAPDRADIVLTRADYRYAHWWDWAGAEQDFAQAMKLEPKRGYDTLARWSRLRAATGHLDEAIVLARQSAAANPSYEVPHRLIGYYALAEGRYAEADAALLRALQIEPLDEHSQYYRGLIQLLQGLPEAALPRFQDSSHELRLTGLAIAYDAMGDRPGSDRQLQLLITRYGHILPYNVAEVYAWRGDRDKAFEWLARAYDLRDASLMYLCWDPLLASIRDDRRLADLANRIHVPAQVSSLARGTTPAADRSTGTAPNPAPK